MIVLYSDERDFAWKGFCSHLGLPEYRYEYRYERGISSSVQDGASKMKSWLRGLPDVGVRVIVPE